MKINILDRLVEESNELNSTNPVINPNAHTVSLYKAVTNRIYNDIVQVGETKTRVANVFCWEHLDANGELIINTPTTYSGKFGTYEREELKKEGLIFPDKEDFVKGAFFLHEDVVYQATIDNPFDGVDGSTDEEKLEMATFMGNIRYATEASDKDGFAPTESSFRMRSWRGRVRNRRTKLDITDSALRGLGDYLGSDPELMVIDSIANVIADDINKDIIHKLISVSKRFITEKYDNKPFIDFTSDDRDRFVIGREIYALITEMSAHVTKETKFTPDFVLTSPRVAGLVNSSGMSEAVDKGSKNIKDKYILNNGLTMRVDATAQFDYIVVGVNNDNASSLYLSNFTIPVKFNTQDHDQRVVVGAEGDQVVDTVTDGSISKTQNLGVFTIHRVVNNQTLNDSYMALARYALTSPPYSGKDVDDKGEPNKIVFGDEWEENANTSPLSRFIGIKLPKVE